MFRNSFRVNKINAGEKVSFEFLECIITSSSADKLRVVIIYRPQYSGEHPVTTSTFCTEFSSYMESILLSKESLIITGDINIHVNDRSDANALKFLDILECMGLQQHVTKPTHVPGHPLDLIITCRAENIILDTLHVYRSLFDHAAVTCKLAVPKPLITIKKGQV